jgi:predicted lactoylglutathione lyase
MKFTKEEIYVMLGDYYSENTKMFVYYDVNNMQEEAAYYKGLCDEENKMLQNKVATMKTNEEDFIKLMKEEDEK